VIVQRIQHASNRRVKFIQAGVEVELSVRQIREWAATEGLCASRPVATELALLGRADVRNMTAMERDLSHERPPSEVDKKTVKAVAQVLSFVGDDRLREIHHAMSIFCC
jgi:hypothetical protein